MADTLFLKSNDRDLQIAADIVRSDGTVIFPTETVYGLGANALSSLAVDKIFTAKGRPSDNPLIVHIHSLVQLSDLVSNIPDDAKKLMSAFWPGPLTIILKKSAQVPSNVTAGLDTVGIRMPSNPIAASFLKLSDIPIAAPSANLSGKPSPTEFKHCVEDMRGRVDAIIDGGTCDVGVESTVIDLSDKPIIFRPGDITKQQIEEVLNKHVEAVYEIKTDEKAKSPGLKYKHYSPNAAVVIMRGDITENSPAINSINERVGVLAFDEQIEEYKNQLNPDSVVLSLGSMSSPKEVEASLFSRLRDADEYGVKVVFAPEIQYTDEWMAVRNRLYRAAGNLIITAEEYKENYGECEI